MHYGILDTQDNLWVVGLFETPTALSHLTESGENADDPWPMRKRYGIITACSPRSCLVFDLWCALGPWLFGVFSFGLGVFSRKFTWQPLFMRWLAI